MADDSAAVADMVVDIAEDVVPDIPENNTDIGPVCLVVGGAGYVGSHIVKRLLKYGYEVRSFDVNPCPVEDPKLTSIQGDIRNYDDLAKVCEGVNTVFHTVALINQLGLYRARIRNLVMDINVAGTRQLLQAAWNAGVKQFVYTSSHAVTFDHEVVMGDESTLSVTRPRDLYSETKAMAEDIVLNADNRKYGMRTVAIRPGGVWGGDNLGLMVGQSLEAIARSPNNWAMVGDGSGAIDFTHVENLVDGHIMAAEKLITDPERCGGEAYYIHDEEPMNVTSWMNEIIRQLGWNPKIRKVPKSLVFLIGFIVELVHYIRNADGDVMPTRASIDTATVLRRFKTDKARRDLGWVPRWNRVTGVKDQMPIIKERVAAITAKK